MGSMKLGEAFVEVRADLTRFTRDLDRELRVVVENFERRLNRNISSGLQQTFSQADGRRLGENLGDGVSEGLNQRLGRRNSSVWTRIAAAFGSALDDGLSALPTEVKATIVAGMLLAAPIVAGTLAGAVSAGLGFAVAGIGTLVAFQYEEVQAAGEKLAETLRLQLVDAAAPFVPVVLAGIAAIEKRFRDMGPTINTIFGGGATFLEPLLNGILGFVEGVLNGIEGSLGDIDGFVDVLSAGLTDLGEAVGQAFEILASTGEDGEEVFKDFIQILAEFTIAVAEVIKFLTHLYVVMEDVFNIVLAFNPVFGEEETILKGVTRTTEDLTEANTELGYSTTGVITLTKAQQKEIKELTKQIKDASDATYELIGNDIDFQEALDNITESLKENGKTLDINTEKGRENARSFIRGLEEAQARAEDRITSGQLSAQQAAQFYNQEIESVRKLATQAGITNATFDQLFGSIIATAQLRLDSAAMGITEATTDLAGARDEAARLYEQLLRIKTFKLPSVGTRIFSEYADGGIVDGPTPAIIGEAGREVVIPLTKPARAAQLAQQSGLTQMLGGGGPSVINVFVGNEQLDARTYRIVEQNNKAQSLSLSYGPRGL